MTCKTFCEQKNYCIQNPKFLDTGNYAPIIGHPLGGGGPRANTILYGDLYGDLHNHFTHEEGKIRELLFINALHHGENRGVCKKIKSFSSCLK